MIDKPKDKFDKVVYELADWLNDTAEDCREVFSAGFVPVWQWLGRYKYLRPIAVILLAGLIVLGIVDAAMTPKAVNLVEKDSYSIKTTEYMTRTGRVDRFMEKYNVSYDPAVDKINHQGHDLIRNGMTVEIEHPFEVYLVVDKERYSYNSFGITVDELLEHFNVELGPYDEVSPALGTVLFDRDTVTVKRVLVTLEHERIETEYETQYVSDSSIAIGETKIVQKGVNGIEEKTFVKVTVDGKVISRTLMEHNVLQVKQDRIIHYGMKILKGAPSGLKYLYKIDNVKAYSYNYSGHRIGVYGLWCSYGTVAVDRKVIPLGSKLYIEGYGYAIANDVGGSIKGNTVDLYMERRAQCGKWGARRVTVYVLSEGDNTRYWERSKLDESLKFYVDGVLQYPS